MSTKDFNPWIALGINLLTPIIEEKLGINLLGDSYNTNIDDYPEISEIPPVKKLQAREGTIVPVLGAPEEGKTVVACRLAELIDRPTYMVSPAVKPKYNWIKHITFDAFIRNMDKKSKVNDQKIEPYSVVILDDALDYASSKDARENDAKVRELERIIPVARHEHKIILIVCAQVSSLLDKYLLSGAMIVLKRPSILFEDTERIGVKKLYDRAYDSWEGQSDAFCHRHAYIISHNWEGLAAVNLPQNKEYYDEEGEFTESKD